MYQVLDGKKVFVKIECLRLFGRGVLNVEGKASVNKNIITLTREYDGIKTIHTLDMSIVEVESINKGKDYPAFDYSLDAKIK